MAYKGSPVSIAFTILTVVLMRNIIGHSRSIHVVERVGWVQDVGLGHPSLWVVLQLLVP